MLMRMFAESVSTKRSQNTFAISIKAKLTCRKCVKKVSTFLYRKVPFNMTFWSDNDINLAALHHPQI